ncbi:MAG: hypothetical protein A4E73_03383 [Syntrophaceae bacterium PtaU1.Bin231]|nr:MAG: hypothetical protein A4E73_03383 [Syntrophaceae bacterium PtaU1.Bin231]
MKTVMKISLRTGIRLFLLFLTAGLILSFSAWTEKVAFAAAAKEVIHPVSLFDKGKARHFTYKTEDGITIKYFIVKSSDGVIRAAFDACDVCWQEGKGYTQKSDFMVCNNCGKRFKSTRINEVSGGCNPAPLARKVEGGNVILSTRDLLEGKRYFVVTGGGRR